MASEPNVVLQQSLAESALADYDIIDLNEEEIEYLNVIMSRVRNGQNIAVLTV